ncbi:CaiB/BaiF CoA transferase family protein [Blastococcus tunisiensis]|uniref:CaiB/BaiF CoA transferase family protein n=1 Tax=Blastococcus tunisiensis TaxID=1798228 RepID=UPI00158790AC|nr:CoA transferase [Blastococcus sp. DSM 46838]
MTADGGNGHPSPGSPVLEGIRVLDLTQQLSGPYAGMILADLGADVIKVEAPHRPDPARVVPGQRVGGHSSYYLSLNRNKRSIALDLKDPCDHEAFMRLVEESNVVLDNFRPGVTTRLGVDRAALEARNPAIVTCSVTGFGETGPERNRPAYDYLMQALAGSMGLTGEPDGPPTKYGLSVVDHVGGLFAVIGVLGSLLGRRDPQAPGRHVDVSLLDSHLSMLSYVAADLLAGGEPPVRQRLSSHPRAVAARVYRTADGWVVLMPLAEHFWPRLCAVLGADELADDPQFVDAEARLAHRDELFAILEPLVASRTTAEWMDLMVAADVPAAPVQSVAEAIAMPQTTAREMVVELAHPAYGAYRAMGNPVKISASGPALVRGAPELGEHNGEILHARGIPVHDRATPCLPVELPAVAEQ